MKLFFASFVLALFTFFPNKADAQQQRAVPADSAYRGSDSLKTVEALAHKPIGTKQNYSGEDKGYHSNKGVIILVIIGVVLLISLLK